jgi:hypothetical protein
MAADACVVKYQTAGETIDGPPVQIDASGDCSEAPGSSAIVGTHEFPPLKESSDNREHHGDNAAQLPIGPNFCMPRPDAFEGSFDSWFDLGAKGETNSVFPNVRPVRRPTIVVVKLGF